MPKQECHKNQSERESDKLPLAFFACPNNDRADFNHFGTDNLSIAEWMGKDKAIRWLYCKTCGTSFSERQGSLMQYSTPAQADEGALLAAGRNTCDGVGLGRRGMGFQMGTLVDVRQINDNQWPNSCFCYYYG